VEIQVAKEQRVPSEHECPPSWIIRKKDASSKWTLPFVWLEWISEQIAFSLSRVAFLQILEYAGRFSVVVGVIFYLAETQDRVKQRQYQAWQVVYSATGKAGDGGRRYALQDLVKDNVPLRGINLENAQLSGVALANADMNSVILSKANLKRASLKKATLERATMISVFLRDAEMDEANLSGANLYGAYLQGSVIDRGRLRGANLTESDFSYASLRNTSFQAGFEDSPVDKYGAIYTDIRHTAIVRATFSFANLDGATFRGASLYDTSFYGASLQNADFSDARIKSSRFGDTDLKGAKFRDVQFSLLTDDELNDALRQGGDTLGGHVCSNCSGSDFRRADLRNADFEGANVNQLDFSEADLRGASLKGLVGWQNIASLKGANIYGVQNAPAGFVEWARTTMGALSEQDDAKWKSVFDAETGLGQSDRSFKNGIKYHPELHLKHD
jgi:uncharacterized protein YjbI with pentapeptide repeats